LEENINSLVLTYALGVSLFPARSGFTPGWAYVCLLEKVCNKPFQEDRPKNHTAQQQHSPETTDAKNPKPWTNTADPEHTN